MNSNSGMRGRLQNSDFQLNRCVVCFNKLDDIKNVKFESVVEAKSTRNNFSTTGSNLETTSESVNNHAEIITNFLRLFELDIPKSIYSQITTSSSSSNRYFGFCEECKESVLQIDAFLIQIQILQDQVQEMKGKIKYTICKSRRYFREKENISADFDFDSDANIVRMIRDLTTGVRVALTPIRIPRKQETHKELQDADKESVSSSVDVGVLKSENNAQMPIPTAAEAIQPMWMPIPTPIEIPSIPIPDSYDGIGYFTMGIFSNETNDEFGTSSYDYQLHFDPGSDPLSLDATAAASSLLPLSFELRKRKISQSVILPGNDEDNINNDVDESGGDPEFEVFTISSDEDYCVKSKSRSSRKRLMKTRRKPSIRMNRAVPAGVKSKSVPSPSRVSPGTSKNKNIQKQQPQPQQPANHDESHKNLERNEIVSIAIPSRSRSRAMPKPQPHRKSNTKTRAEQEAYLRENRVLPEGPLFVKGIEIISINNGYKCSVCDGDKTFFTIHWTSISNHVKRKHCEDRSDWLQCETCGKQFFNKHSLTAHTRVVHEASDLRPYMCDICGRQFKCRPNMVNHRHIHDENRAKFSCEFCGKQFLRVRDCVVHTRTHTKERPFQCDLCPKNFIVRTQLNSHMKTHETSSTLPSPNLSSAPAAAQRGDKDISNCDSEEKRLLS